jgi:cytochrome c553
MLHRLAFVVGLSLTVAFPLAASAASAPAQVPLCASCHGNGGVSGSPNIPSLAGQQQGYLQAALNDYKNHQRLGASADMMAAIAAQLSAADIRALAAYYSSLKGS